MTDIENNNIVRVQIEPQSCYYFTQELCRFTLMVSVVLVLGLASTYVAYNYF